MNTTATFTCDDYLLFDNTNSSPPEDAVNTRCTSPNADGTSTDCYIIAGEHCGCSDTARFVPLLTGVTLLDPTFGEVSEYECCYYDPSSIPYPPLNWTIPDCSAVPKKNTIQWALLSCILSVALILNALVLLWRSRVSISAKNAAAHVPTMGRGEDASSSLSSVVVVDIVSDGNGYTSPFRTEGRADRMDLRLKEHADVSETEYASAFAITNEQFHALETCHAPFRDAVLWIFCILFFVVGGFLIIIFEANRAKYQGLVAIDSGIGALCRQKKLSYAIIVGSFGGKHHAGSATVIRITLPAAHHQSHLNENWYHENYPNS
eukprot:CAMPEP_0194099064 /NCGR_PEP_ID=MMETSP0150-20130528/339_1 /TAXON_ID=122233 /ORGANISM="Chaetoceros debilis, Strain MM31A-1" /LENGTH=319 /DNA_ID=CAMNT_0038785205 /DNA_START=34 /DNA_END=993 /DNA_ORIENTATION=+